jgi:phosphatidylserine decarboxylase
MFMIPKSLFVFSQYLTPQHGLSKFAGQLADSHHPLIKNRFINWFVKQYQVNMEEALIEEPEAYPSFNEFFTRALKPGARPIDETAGGIVSPVDGAVSQLGRIEEEEIFQAKGQSFDLTRLLGGDPGTAEPFVDGEFATLYLSPKDYHRIHMPIAGTLKKTVYIPGKLFSVNPSTAQRVPQLFARNERFVAIFDTELGPMAMVLVGAMIVASIETVWSGLIKRKGHTPITTHYNDENPIHLKKGEEMGRFKLGSTVVLCFPKGKMQWDSALKTESIIRMGKKVGSIKS